MNSVRTTRYILREKRIHIKKLQTIVWKMLYSDLIMPEATGFFVHINKAMRGNSQNGGTWKDI